MLHYVMGGSYCVAVQVAELRQCWHHSFTSGSESYETVLHKKIGKKQLKREKRSRQSCSSMVLVQEGGGRMVLPAGEEQAVV